MLERQNQTNMLIKLRLHDTIGVIRNIQVGSMYNITMKCFCDTGIINKRNIQESMQQSKLGWETKRHEWRLETYFRSFALSASVILGAGT
jgi:hypothetical protein